MEAYNANYVGGDINGGADGPRASSSRARSRGSSPYATPDPRLFICSSSTPPGGGVHGMCGYFAAQARCSGRAMSWAATSPRSSPTMSRLLAGRAQHHPGPVHERRLAAGGDRAGAVPRVAGHERDVADLDAERLGRQPVGLGRRLEPRDLLGGEDRLEAVGDAGVLERAVTPSSGELVSAHSVSPPSRRRSSAGATSACSGSRRIAAASSSGSGPVADHLAAPPAGRSGSRRRGR